jgi:hypothetical protein
MCFKTMFITKYSIDFEVGLYGFKRQGKENEIIPRRLNPYKPTSKSLEYF